LQRVSGERPKSFGGITWNQGPKTAEIGLHQTQWQRVRADFRAAYKCSMKGLCWTSRTVCNDKIEKETNLGEQKGNRFNLDTIRKAVLRRKD
jgi:hypothetical protein